MQSLNDPPWYQADLRRAWDDEDADVFWPLCVNGLSPDVARRLTTRFRRVVASDVIDDACGHATERLHAQTWNAIEKPDGFFVTVARHFVVDVIRDKRQEREVWEAIAASPAATDEVLTEVVGIEAEPAPAGFVVREAVKRLSPALLQTGLYVLRFGVDSCSDFAAAELDIAPGTYRTRLSRVKEKLRQIIPRVAAEHSIALRAIEDASLFLESPNL